MIRRLRAAYLSWLLRERSAVDHDSARAYRDATHIGMCDIGQGFIRSNLEDVIDNERYLESFRDRVPS